MATVVIGMPQRCDKGTKVCNKLEKNDPVFAGQRCEVPSDCKGKYYISTENLFEFPLTFPSHCFSVVASEEPLIWNLINIKENWAFLKSSLSSLTKLNMYIILLMH